MLSYTLIIKETAPIQSLSINESIFIHIIFHF